MHQESRKKMMKAFKHISLIGLTLAFLHAPNASALTVVTHFIGGVAPANAVGGGNLEEIVNAAARIWESAYADAGELTINFGWAPVGDAGTHTLVLQSGTPNREVTGIILFDNSGACPFYLDPTPDTTDEYRRRTEEFQELGGGSVNVARVFSSPVGDAVGHTDLLSVALHEMGHALGICASNTSFRLAAAKGAITITGALPFAGTVIPLAINKSGITSHIDALQVAYGSLMSGVGSDERRLPSALDILINAQISGFVLPILDPSSASQSNTASGHTIAHQISIDPVRRISKKEE